MNTPEPSRGSYSYRIEGQLQGFMGTKAHRPTLGKGVGSLLDPGRQGYSRNPFVRTALGLLRLLTPPYTYLQNQNLGNGAEELLALLFLNFIYFLNSNYNIQHSVSFNF